MFTSRKRARDEEEGDYEVSTRVVKQCRLPFRTSPTSKYSKGFSQSSRCRPVPLFTQTITPAESSEEEVSPPFPSSCNPRLPYFPQPSTGSTLDSVEQSLQMDIDMMDYQPIASPRYLGQNSIIQSPKASPCTAAPPPLAFRDPFNDYQSSASGGRLPTPIYGHFQQSIDAKMDLGGDSEIATPRTQQVIEYEKYVRRRRLPTPIDEDEAMDPSITMDPLALDTDQYQVSATTKPSYSFSPPSRATRLSFSMGIRADCDLCRMKVPGHSNHIFRA